ncbi:DHHA1 domain-containing protein [Streptomyces sp. NPDC046685]|uniref:DHHA1 domain-containing protein n=1 Tax=Streptomyces sp. NPDC046685 TaxID=3157202 RepID=UPI0033DCE312
MLVAPAGELADTATDAAGVQTVTVTTEGAADDARALAVAVRDRLPGSLPGAVAVGTATGLVIALNPAARQVGLNASALVKQLLGGRGGGSGELAQGGGLAADAITGALASLPALIASR